jgi:hypothetical protein
MSAIEKGVDQGLLAGLDRVLKLAAAIRGRLPLILPAEARILEATIEGFEKRYANFLALPEGTEAEREVAREAILKFAALRADLTSRSRESGN